MRSSSASRQQFIVTDEAAGLRLDQCLARCVPELSRRTARLALDVGCVFVDRRRVKVAGRRVCAGQVITLHLGGAYRRALSDAEAGTSLDARERTLPEPQVLFEDDDIVVVLKPSRLLTAPTPESDRNNLLSILARARSARLFVVHRLDLETSGVLVVAKTKLANRELSERFKRHDLKRQYDAFVDGAYPVTRETLSAPLHGKHATSHVEVATRYSEATRLLVTLETGRTHQIRLHLLGRGSFVLGDPKYGKKTRHDPPRMALHARCLELPHPRTGEPLRFFAPLPEDLEHWAMGLAKEPSV